MQKRRTIYGVFANTAYEGGDIVRSFDAEADAEAFAKKCREHEEKRPIAPSVGAADAEWETYLKRNDNWEKRHPARPYSHRSYAVAPVRHYPK